MRKTQGRTAASVAATVGAVTVSAVTLFPAAAQAAGTSKSCPETFVCTMQASGFPGGSISVDADVAGSGTGRWTLDGPNGRQCSTSFPASGGVRSWVCNNAPAGTYVLRVYPGQSYTDASGGIRW